MNNNVNPVKNLLAFVGSGMQTLDSAYLPGDQRIRPQSRINEIEVANKKIIHNFSHPQPDPYDNSTPQFVQEPVYQQPVQPQYQYEEYKIPQTVTIPEHIDNNVTMNWNTDNHREDRINRFLGKTAQPKPQDNPQSLDKVIAAALKPVEDRLEDISILTGLVVQRLEELINIVNDNPAPSEMTMPIESPEGETFQEVETFDPEVSMVLTKDEDQPQQKTTTTKKRNKK